MRREAEFFGNRELILVFMAKRLKEARAVEKLLDEAGFNYAIETGHYQSGLLFRSERVGAFFYVAPEEETDIRLLLQKNDFTPYDPKIL